MMFSVWETVERTVLIGFPLQAKSTLLKFSSGWHYSRPHREQESPEKVVYPAYVHAWGP